MMKRESKIRILKDLWKRIDILLTLKGCPAGQLLRFATERGFPI